MIDDLKEDNEIKAHGLQKILFFKGLQPFLTQIQWDDLGKNLGIHKDDVGRTWGIEIEDSFYLLALTYKNVDAVILLEESISRLSELPSVDCILVLNNGERICLEIKATQNTKWKIGKGRFDRQQSFASKLGMRLYYAIFIQGYWTIYESAKLKELGYAVSFPSSFNQSVFNHLFNPQLVRIPKGLIIRTYYSTIEESKAIGAPDPKYGFPFRYELEYFGVIVPLSEPMDLMAIAGIESAFRRQSIQMVTQELHIGTKETEDAMDVYDYSFFLAPIYSTVSSTNGQYYNSSTFISKALDMLKRGERIGFLEAVDKGLSLVAQLRSKGIPLQIVHWSDIPEWKFLT